MKSTSILKHNLMRATLTLALIVTCATAWAQNPNLADYTFTTGQDASKWITLSGNATQMIASGEDDANSNLTSIGFDFPFGDGTYTQFWTNSNGILSFNSNPTSNYACQFTQFGYQNNQPKICGISADMSTGNNGYVKYELTGTAPTRVLVCEFFLYGKSNTTNPANIKWQVQLHEADAKVVMVYGDALDTNLNSNQIGLSQSSSDIWTINPSTHEAIHSTGFVGAKYSSWPGAYRYYQFNPPVPFTDNGDGTYTINTAAGWDVFCDSLQYNPKGHFTGKTVKLDADIEVSRMAGSAYHDFTGTFDGQGNTLTFAYEATADTAAPFRYVEGTSETVHAAIQNLNVNSTITGMNCKYLSGLVGLSGSYVDVSNCNVEVHITSTQNSNSDMCPSGLVSRCTGMEVTISGCTVTGEIATNGKYAGGLIADARGSVSITNCVSSVTINSSTAGDGTHGGLVAVTQPNTTTTIEGCLFNGKLLTVGETDTGNCGGILGWKNATVTIKNTLYAPAELNDGEREVVAGKGDYPSGTFYRGNTPTLTNCYYTRALGTPQGTQAYSITAGENVTVDYHGTPTNTYPTSGITAYMDGNTQLPGLKYGDVLYAGNEETISLTLGNTPPPGSLFMGYTVSPEGTTLNGNNPYTLTMPDENVIIGAVIKDPVTYLNENGVEQTKQPSDYTLLTGSETSIGTANQETWYVADGTINFNHTIIVDGVVHLILKDNAVMNVGTNESPITGSGISAEGPSISIYGQSTGTNIGMLSIYTTNCGIYDYDYGNNNNPNYDYAVTINGGNIYLSCSQYGIQSNKVSINGGQVWATAGQYGIASNPNAITLGWTSPYDGIYAVAYQGDVIVKSGKAFINNDYQSNNVVTGTVNDYSLINGMFLQPAVAVTLNDGITAGSGFISSGDNLYAQAAVDVTVDANNVTAPTGYAVSGITVTPTVTVTDNGNGTYSFTTPAANVTVSPTFELQPVSVNYIDADGVQQTVDALPLLGGGATTLAAGWYVVNSDISYTGTVTLGGNVHLILCDGYTMNVGTSDSRINGDGITPAFTGSPTLTIYGQSTGDHIGTLSVYTTGYYCYGIRTEYDLTINGGHVIANTNGKSSYALYSYNRNVIINGGIVEATATDAEGHTHAIYANQNFTYTGGIVEANAASGYAIIAGWGQHYTFTWRNPNDHITIGSTGLYDSGSATATFTKAFTDGTNIYSGTLTGTEAISALAGKTLYPAVAVTLHDGITASNGIITSGGNLYAKVGQTITVTLDAGSITVPEGYVVSGITVTPTVEVTGSNGTYSFTMPAEDVTVSHALAPIDWATESDGSAEHPYMIYNKDQLNLLAQRVNSGQGYYGSYFKLGADITYPHTTDWNDATSTENNYTAIGGYHEGNRFFCGHFDGDGHTISGIRVYKGDNDYQGLFGMVSGADIHDVTLANARITGGANTGGIVGYNSGIEGDNFGTVTRCHVASNVAIHADHDWAERHGGIVGENAYYCIISHCTSAATLTIDANATDCKFYGAIAGNSWYEHCTIEDNLAIGATLPAVPSNFQGAICGINDGALARNYYYNCTVAGVQNATNVGCSYYDHENNTIANADVTDNDGAMYAVIRMVEGYGESTASDHWTFISSPLSSNITATDVVNLINTTTPANYDFYRLNNTTWENIKANTSTNHSDFTELVNGQGYLYANKNDVGLVFKGTYNTDDTKAVELQREWNLVGNPFDAPATVDMNYFRMNEGGTAIEPIDITQNTNPIDVCTGIVVKQPEGAKMRPTIIFTRVTTQQNASNNKGGLQISLAQTVTTRGGSSTETLDNAIVSFNEGSQLGKFYFGTQNANIYLPQDGKEYAIVSAGNVGEIPVNFKAHENGTYTLTVSSTLNSQLSTLNFHYLHLIDNLTGADVDLLAGQLVPEPVEGPASYTFSARTTDYESRFKLVFVANNNGDGASTGSATFAYNFNGSWIINNAGEATLQVIDLNGRILSSETVNGSVSKSIHAAPGVYMLRLVNSNDVKTQKIVIE